MQSCLEGFACRFGLAAWLLAVSSAGAVEWNPERPEAYRVVEGDTLWSIAGRFLQRPWDWPQVWRGNPGIERPDRIYPGDLIVVEGRGGAPHLHLQGVASERLSPHVRVTPLANPVPVIPLDAIRPFLSRPQVIEAEALDSLPYVVDLAEEHVIGGPGDRFYVRAIPQPRPVDYTVLRPGEAYREGTTGAILGHEAIYVADAVLEQAGDPATLMVKRAQREARIGDRLLPTQPLEIGTGFHPHAARAGLRGHIISVLDGVSQIGRFSVVAIDRGQADRVQVGDVFEIWQKGEALRDTIRPQFGEKLVGPEQKAGVLMAFLIYRRVSFALVMQAERFLHVMDSIRAP